MLTQSRLFFKFNYVQGGNSRFLESIAPIYRLNEGFTTVIVQNTPQLTDTHMQIAP